MLTVALVALTVGKLDVSFAPDRLTSVEYSLALSSKGHKWIFETRVLKRYQQDEAKYVDRFVRATCDGKTMWREQVGMDKPKHLPYGNFIRFSKPTVKAPWQIVAIRGHYGLGAHWDTHFYSLNGRKLNLLGRPPAANSNGPVNYEGKPDQWLFDDFDHYIMRDEKKPLSYVLYSLDGPNKLRKVRLWRSNGKRLKDTVGLSKW